MFRDITLSAAAKKKELIIFLSCFAGVYVLNVIGIILHKSPGKELFTQLHVVLLVTLVIYGIVVALRIFYHLMSRLWNRK